MTPRQALRRGCWDALGHLVTAGVALLAHCKLAADLKRDVAAGACGVDGPRCGAACPRCSAQRAVN